MADITLFSRLKRLFSADVIIRNVGGNQIKVADTNRLQSSGNLATNVLIDRYQKLWNSKVIDSGMSPGEATMIYRKEMFTDYDAMETDSIICQALNIYADECTTKDEFGDTITIRSSNPAVQKILRNLFYDILNVEFNMWPWIRNMVKYGDSYLKLNIVEKFGIINVEPMTSYQMIREDGIDETGKQYVKFKMDPSSMGSRQFVSRAGHEVTYENYEIAHFRLLSDTNFLPYGKSMLEGCRKVWKQIVLLEDAMLIHHIMRAPEKRVFNIDVGNIPPNEVDAYMQKIIQNTKKIPYQDAQTGEYNLKFNMQNQLEDFYIPKRGPNDGSSIETTKGLEHDHVPSLDYLKARLLASLAMPKAFLNFTEDLGGKATLASQDLRFARTIERLQRIVVSELYKIAIIHLYVQGYRDADLLDFELSMTSPSTVYEREKIDLWQAKVNLGNDFVEKKMASIEFVYKEIFNMTDDQYQQEMEKIINDAKFLFRYKQISEEGNDPVKTGKSFGTSHDIAQLYKGDGGLPTGYDEKDDSTPMHSGKDDRVVRNTMEDPEKIGRKPKHSEYGTHDHPLGNDPIARKAISKPNLESALSRYAKEKTADILKETFGDTFTKRDMKAKKKRDAANEEKGLLSESNILDIEEKPNK